MAKSFMQDVLPVIRQQAENTRHLGTGFEVATKYFLRNDPYWSKELTNVCLWAESSDKKGQDCGIDLTANDKFGKKWAIQSKCYSEGHKLDYKECATFFSTSSVLGFDNLMLVTTCESLSSNLVKHIELEMQNNGRNVVIINSSNIESSTLEWDRFLDGDMEHASLAPKFEPKPHQRAAIDDITAEFGQADRCKAIMACGTGKTFMSQRLSEEYLADKESPLILFAAPSIALVGQSMRSWVNQTAVGLRTLVVCSDAKASRLDDELSDTLADLAFPATTSPSQLYSHWKTLSKEPGPIAIFSTYQSMQVISDAQDKGLPEFDLIVYDEAHRATGYEEPGTSKQDASAFTKVHDNDIVKGAKRLYMTATERIYGTEAKDKRDQQGFVLTSMGDESIYVFDLRGNQRTQGEQSRKEGGKIFGSGSRAPVTITMLVKSPDSNEHGVIRYHDIGDYLTQGEKLQIVKEAAEQGGPEWEILTMDRHGDWLDQRDDSWYDFAPLGIEKMREPSGIFKIWSRGVATARDTFSWGFNKSKVANNMSMHIDFYEAERARTQTQQPASKLKDKAIYDETRCKWNRSLLQRLGRNEEIVFDASLLTKGLYRPFCKQWLYNDSALIDMVYQTSKLFPTPDTKNIVIMVPGKSNTGFSCFISNCLTDLNCMNAGTQCFPLYWYETEETGGLLGDSGKAKRHDAITNRALEVFRKVYPHVYASGIARTVERAKADGLSDKQAREESGEIAKVDIFYYIYGILHSPEYRERFAANLTKELPRIPFAADFKRFAQAGRDLAKLHLDYEPTRRAASSTIQTTIATTRATSWTSSSALPMWPWRP